MKRLALLAFAALATSVLWASAATALDPATASDLALLGEAQNKVQARLATASVQKGSSEYALRGELQQIDGLIAALEAGEKVDPSRVEQILRRSRVLP